MALPPNIANQESILHLPRQKALQGLVMVGRYNFSQAQRELENHIHEGAFEFCYLDKGRQSYHVEKNYYHLRGGDCFFTHPGEEHSSGEFPQDKNVLYWLAVRLDDEQYPLFQMPARQQKSLRNELTRLPSRYFAGKVSIKDHFDVLLETLSQRQTPLRTLVIANRVQSLLLEYIDCGKQERTPTVSDPIQLALDHIHENLGDSLSIPILAGISGLSEPHFKVSFKDHTGIPPAEYVQRTRVSEAKQLLHTSDSSITEIAFRLGFNSSQYFATVFKRYERINPGAYRRKRN